MDGLDANWLYLTYCLTPVVSTAISQTVSSLWGPVAVTDGGLGVSGPLAQSASVAGGLESWGNNSGPAWVSLGEDWSISVAESVSISVALAKALGGPVGEGDTATVVSSDSASVSIAIAQAIGISRALANTMGECTVAVVGDAESGVGASLLDVSTKTVSISIGITLVEALGGPLGVGGGVSGVDGDTTGSNQAITISVGISISITLAIGTLWGPVAVGESSGVDASTSQSTAISVAPGVSGPLADKVSEAASGVAAVTGVDAGLADESTGSKAETTKTITPGIGISIALAKTLWGPVAEGDTCGVSADAAAVSQSKGEWGISVAPGVS